MNLLIIHFKSGCKLKVKGYAERRPRTAMGICRLRYSCSSALFCLPGGGLGLRGAQKERSD